MVAMSYRGCVLTPRGLPGQPGSHGSQKRTQVVTDSRWQDVQTPPYERAQTYRVHAQVTFVVAPDEPQTYDYQFRIQD